MKKRKSIFYDDDEKELLISQLITADVFSRERKGGGSHVGRSPNLPRMYQEGHLCIMKDYFDNDLVYNDRIFCQRFCMRHSLFLSIVDAVTEYDIYFIQRPVSILHLSIPNLRVKKD